MEIALSILLSIAIIWAIVFITFALAEAVQEKEMFMFGGGVCAAILTILALIKLYG
jgi:hypothetical protein